MMVSDNDDAYNLSPAFILEAVAAAKEFVKTRGGDVTPDRQAVPIAAFLAWPQERVKYALAQLSAIEKGDLSKKVVESLPTIHAATTLHRQVKKAKEARTPIPKVRQIEIEKRASESVPAVSF